LVARFLTAGEDFEILAAVRPESAAAFVNAAGGAGVPVHRIGALTEGTGLTKVLFEGTPLALSQRAFVHGRVEKTR
jgi:thiamine-monophosphate kinase